MKESVTSPKKSSTSGKATPLATDHNTPQKMRNQSQPVANRNWMKKSNIYHFLANLANKLIISWRDSCKVILLVIAVLYYCLKNILDLRDARPNDYARTSVPSTGHVTSQTFPFHCAMQHCILLRVAPWARNCLWESKNCWEGNIMTTINLEHTDYKW